MALRCFDHAFALADDSNVADVWYNIGQVAIGMAISRDCKLQTPTHTYLRLKNGAFEVIRQLALCCD